MSDWSTLPYDLIHKVASYLTAIEDFLSFSAVCCSWRSVYSAKEWHQGPQLPWLMLSDHENTSSRKFISLNGNKLYNLNIPEARDRRCWGSSSGWILTTGSYPKVNLLNPITRVSLTLPSKLLLRINDYQPVDWYDIVNKAFLFKKKPCTRSSLTAASANQENELLVMIICGRWMELAFCRPGCSSWTSVKEVGGGPHYGFTDVACVRDQIFALCDNGSLVVVDDGDGVVVNCISDSRPPGHLYLSFSRWLHEQAFLVEASGDLWMVYLYPHTSIVSASFVVFNFDFIEKRWIRLSDLGSHTIFVGDSSCVCVSATEGLLNCERNSICFIEKEMDKERPFRVVDLGVGVYRFSSRISKPMRLVPSVPEYYFCLIWLVPTLQ